MTTVNYRGDSVTKYRYKITTKHVNSFRTRPDFLY